jgi:hypothetical protein
VSFQYLPAVGTRRRNIETDDHSNIGTTIQSTNTSQYLNIGTNSKSYKPLSFGATPDTKAWALEGDTIITGTGSSYGRRKSYLFLPSK